MVRIASIDVANSSNRSSVQLLTGQRAVLLYQCALADLSRRAQLQRNLMGPPVRPVPASRLGPPPSGRRSPADRFATHEVSPRPRCRHAPRSKNFESSQATQHLSDGSNASSQQLAHTPPSTPTFGVSCTCNCSFLGVREDSQALHTWFSHLVPRPDTRIPSNCANGKEAEFQELAKAGIGAHARCESVSGSLSLGFCMALVVKKLDVRPLCDWLEANRILTIQASCRVVKARSASGSMR